MSLDYTSLERAVIQLKQALDSYNDDVIQNNPIYKKQMRSAVIQAFEFTYELTFGMIKRHLRMSMSNPAAVDSMNFKDIIREAYKNSLVSSDLSVWEYYRENRGITSHTYDEKNAQKVFESASEFLDEARYVLSSLQYAKPKKSRKEDLQVRIAELKAKLDAILENEYTNGVE